jgi:hypothetical protein
MDIENKNKIIEGLKNTVSAQKEALEKAELYIRGNQSIPLPVREQLQKILVPAIYS